MEETGALSPEDLEGREAMAVRHASELRKAWDADLTGDGFAFDMMMDGAWFGLGPSEILKADGLELEDEADRRKAARAYRKALDAYEGAARCTGTS